MMQVSMAEDLMSNKRKFDEKTIFSNFKYVKRFARQKITPSELPNALIVPVGTCPKDLLRLYDTRNKQFTHDLVKLPRNSYDGMKLTHSLQPETQIILMDGEGYKSHGPCIFQHALRLSVHKKFCYQTTCSVMGCKNGAAASIFASVASAEEKRVYETYWRMQNRKKNAAILNHSFRSSEC
jgi:hypothetical protein